MHMMLSSILFDHLHFRFSFSFQFRFQKTNSKQDQLSIIPAHTMPQAMVHSARWDPTRGHMGPIPAMPAHHKGNPLDHKLQCITAKGSNIMPPVMGPNDKKGTPDVRSVRYGTQKRIASMGPKYTPNNALLAWDP